MKLNAYVIRDKELKTISLPIFRDTDITVKRELLKNPIELWQEIVHVGIIEFNEDMTNYIYKDTKETIIGE